MANVPGSRSMPHRATEAPQATSPSQPGDAVAIAHWGAACLLELLLERRIPLDIPFNVGCGFGHKEANYPTHKGLDFYMTPSDVPVKRSCGFQGIGVSGATVYPAFPGCSHQTTLAKVVYAQNAGGAVGNCVILEHTDNTHEIWIRTIYMHLATIAVTVGQFVPTTTSIGTVGYTGGYKSTNAHLHFEINEQRPANFHWRVAGELALMPDKVVRNRPAIDPEIYLPDVGTGELLRVAAVPPPAQVPAGPSPSYQGLLDPIWLTYQHPYIGEEKVQRVDTFDADSNPRWYLTAWDTGDDAVAVRPLCDGPGGQIYVSRVEDYGVGTYKVQLVHLSSQYRVMAVTEYARLTTVYAEQGTFITPGTLIGESNTASSASRGIRIHQFRRKADSATEWADGEMLDWLTGFLYNQSDMWEFWSDPACCIPEPSTFHATGGSPTWSYLRDCASEPGWA